MTMLPGKVIRFDTKTKSYKDKRAMQKGIAGMKRAGWEVLETEERGRDRRRFKVYYSRRKK